MRTLIDHGLVMTMDAGKIYRDGCVLVEDSMISYVGDRSGLTVSYDSVIDAKGGLVMPGLVNAHTHSPMTLFRGCGNGLALDEWLNDHIFPLEDRLDDEAVYYGTLLGCAEMIRSGTTAFADMYFFSESSVRAILESGMKANVSRCINGMSQDYKKSLAEARALFSAYHMANDGALRIEHAAHAVYICSREVLRKVAEAAKEDGTGVHIHLSETMKENRDCYRKYGKSPTEIMRDMGIFDVRTIAAHGVYLSENDMDILHAYDVSIAHNPTSNLKLASGVANIKEAMEKQVNVALGTDGAASNNALDVFAEMKLAALLHKGMRLDPKLIPAQTALEMATVNGAKALGREQETGKLRAGYKADLIVLDAEAPALNPVHDPASIAVYSGCGGHVVTTVINGTVVMKDREMLTLDMEKIKHGVVKATQRMGL